MGHGRLRRYTFLALIYPLTLGQHDRPNTAYVRNSSSARLPSHKTETVTGLENGSPRCVPTHSQSLTPARPKLVRWLPSCGPMRPTLRGWPNFCKTIPPTGSWIHVTQISSPICVETTSIFHHTDAEHGERCWTSQLTCCGFCVLPLVPCIDRSMAAQCDP